MIDLETSLLAGIPSFQNEDGDGEVKVKLENAPEEDKETTIYTTNHYIGLELAQGAKSLDLSREVNDWKDMCLGNVLFNPHVNSLTIQHVRNFALPDDVFEAGEVKPAKMMKKKRPAEDQAANPAIKRRRDRSGRGRASADK